MGLSYTGNNCLDVTIVNGYNRVPLPPANTIPFKKITPHGKF